jgi:hypothetical protein
MRRNVVTSPETFDLAAWDAMLQAADRSGMSIDDWIQNTLKTETRRESRPSAGRNAAGPASAGLQPSGAGPGPSHGSSWRQGPISQSSRGSATTPVTEALAALQHRLDSLDLDNLPTASRLPSLASRPPTGRGDALPSRHSPPALMRPGPGRRYDPQEDASLTALRADIHSLRASLDGVASRTDLSALEAMIRDLAASLGAPHGPEDLSGLLEILTALQGEVTRLIEHLHPGLHRQVADVLDRLALRLDQAATNGSDPAALQDLSDDLDDLRQIVADLADPQAVDHVAREVARLGQEIAERGNRRLDPRPAKGPGRSSRIDEVAALRQALDALQVEPEAEQPLASGYAADWEGLSRRLDALLAEPRPSLEPVNERLAAIAGHLAELRSSDEPSALAAVLESRLDHLEELLGQLSDQVAQSLDTGPLESLLQDLSRNVEAIQAPQGPLTALEAQVAALVARLERDDAAGIREALREIRAILSGGHPAAGRSVLDQLNHIGVQVEAFAAQTPPGVDHIQGQLAAIASQLDRLGEAGNGTGVAEQLDGIASRLDALGAGAPAHDWWNDRFDRVEDTLRQVAQVADSAPVELMLRGIAGKIDEVQTSQQHFGVIEQQIEALQARLDGLALEIPASGDTSAPIAEQVARLVLQELQASELHSSNQVPAALTRGLDELRALNASLDERTRRTLAAIQANVDDLVERLPALAAEATSVARLKDAVRKLQAPAADMEATPPVPHENSPSEQHGESATSPQPIERVPAALTQGVALTSPEGADPATLRAALIAAARRGGQASPAAAGPEPLPAPEVALDSAAATPGFAGRLRRSLLGRRSTLLTLAAAFLTIGVGQIASTF